MKKQYSEKVINAFLEHDKITDIMEVTKLSRSTIDRYKADPKLQKILSERKAAFVEAAVTKMQAALSESVEILEKIIKNENVAPQTRINAISILFSQCKNWTETADLMKRVELLERENNEF